MTLRRAASRHQLRQIHKFTADWIEPASKRALPLAIRISCLCKGSVVVVDSAVTSSIGIPAKT